MHELKKRLRLGACSGDDPLTPSLLAPKVVNRNAAMLHWRHEKPLKETLWFPSTAHPHTKSGSAGHG